MKANTSIDTNKANHAEITSSAKVILNGQDSTNTLQAQAENKAKPESELRAAARRRGLNLKQLADLMGVSYSYLSQVSSGSRPWSPMLRNRAMAVLGEVPGQGIVYRQGGLVQGESTCIRERAREKGLTQKDLAERVGVSAGYMSDVCRGRRNMSPAVQAKVERVLDAPVEIAPAVRANRSNGPVQGQSTYLREQAREKGLTLRQVADRTGLSYGYVVQVSRGHRNLSPAAQARMESVLEAPVRVEAAQPRDVEPQVLWERMEAHSYSQNRTARLAGISSGHLSQIMNGQRNASGEVLAKLHGVLFAPTAQELVAPVELKVMAWKKGSRNGVVVQGAGGPGNGTIRTGGRVPWGAEVEFAYTTGYDSRGRLSVNHIVDERGCSAMLKQDEPGEED